MEEINVKEEREFNQVECDWKYRTSCVADTNCADECNMKCPYPIIKRKVAEVCETDLE